MNVKNAVQKLNQVGTALKNQQLKLRKHQHLQVLKSNLQQLRRLQLIQVLDQQLLEWVLTLPGSFILIEERM
jgi:hypothetical protein